MIKDQLFKNCSDLPLRRFMSAYFDKELRSLIEQKRLIRAPKKDLAERWSEIIDEYNELNSNEEYTAYFVLLRRLTFLENEISATYTAVESLNINYNLALIKELKALGYNYKFSRKTFRDDLKKCINKSKAKVAEIKRLKADIEPFLNGKDGTKEDFIELVTVVAKYQGYAFDLDKMTVLEFSILLKRYKKTIEDSKKWQTNRA